MWSRCACSSCGGAPAAADVPVPGRNGRAHIRGHGAGGAVLHAARLYGRLAAQGRCHPAHAAQVHGAGPGAGTYLLLFAAFAAVTLLMLGLFMRTLRANGRSERNRWFRRESSPCACACSAFTLTLKSYSGGILTELILLMQVFSWPFPPPTRSPTYTSAAAAALYRRHCGATTRFISLRAGSSGRKSATICTRKKGSWSQQNSSRYLRAGSGYWSFPPCSNRCRACGRSA